MRLILESRLYGSNQREFFDSARLLPASGALREIVPGGSATFPLHLHRGHGAQRKRGGYRDSRQGQFILTVPLFEIGFALRLLKSCRPVVCKYRQVLVIHVPVTADVTISWHRLRPRAGMQIRIRQRPFICRISAKSRPPEALGSSPTDHKAVRIMVTEGERPPGAKR